MDAGGWILLLIVAVCVVALIVIARKRKMLEEDISYESYETDSDSDSVEDIPIGEIIEKIGPPPVTIYEYRATIKKRLCALCDGENDSTATHCYICGQKLY